jgi:hypothetical protein
MVVRAVEFGVRSRVLKGRSILGALEADITIRSVAGLELTAQRRRLDGQVSGFDGKGVRVESVS